MKYHVQFKTVNAYKTGLTDLLGSEGVFILDGRNNLRTMKADALMRMHKLRKIHKICGYEIRKGESFSNSTCIYSWCRSGCLPEHHNRHELEGIIN